MGKFAHSTVPFSLNHLHTKKLFPLGWSGAELISGVSFMKMLTVTDVNCFG